MPSKPTSDAMGRFSHLHDYGCDVHARRVFNHHWMGISEDSHEIGVEYVTRSLTFLDQSKGDIELWINNPGGYLEEMWAIIDVMHVCSNDVATVAYGNVSSAACLMLASGQHGKRWALPHASFMWHAGTTDISQDMHFSDAMDRMEWEKRENQRWVEAMAEVTSPRANGKLLRTKKSRVAFWAEYAQGGGEKWFDAEEMVDHGIVDAVWEKTR